MLRIFWCVLMIGLPAVCLVAVRPAAGQGADELAVLRQVLERAQMLSFRHNSEYCGYLGHDARGELISGPITRGRRDSCLAPWPADLDVLASWHTHAAFDPGAWSEVPTLADILADRDEGIDGYVATPGGRLWHVDTSAMSVRQICPRGCVPADPAFVPDGEGGVLHRYDVTQIRRRERAQ